MAAVEDLKVKSPSPMMPDGKALNEIRIAFRKEMVQRITELELKENIAELDMVGYTVVKNAAPMAFFQELKERILELSRERRKKGVSGDKRGIFSDTMLDVLDKGRVFEQAILNPKINTLAAYLLGDGYVINAHEAIVVDQGANRLPLHSDNAYIPEPFPHSAQTMTCVWFTEDMTEETGSTRVIPGSHRMGRQPSPGEGESDWVPLECPAGSIALWNGATWHGNCGRSAPGQRVTLHTSFCRMHIRPFACNDTVPQEIVDRNPPLLAQLLGRGLPQGREHETGPNPELRQNALRLFLRRM